MSCASWSSTAILDLKGFYTFLGLREAQRNCCYRNATAFRTCTHRAHSGGARNVSANLDTLRVNTCTDHLLTLDLWDALT